MNNTFLTACLIVKNESAVIERLLSNFINVVDEMVILDTGSDDDTVEKITEYIEKWDIDPDKIILRHYKWNDDFGDARNTSFSYANGEYVMWLDADDVCDDNTRDFLHNFRTNKEDSRQYDSYMMEYLLGRDINGNKEHVMKRNRIVRNSCQFKWVGFIHEFLDVTSQNVNIIDTEYFIEHKKDKPYTSRNLDAYQRRVDNGIELSNRDALYYANELYYNEKYDQAKAQYIYCINNLSLWSSDLLTACEKLYLMALSEGDDESVYKWICESFKYESPRADFCCYLGDYMFNKGRYKQCMTWYMAATCGDDDKQISLFNKKYSTWYPWLQLSVAYWNTGDIKTATECHNKAKALAPDNQTIIDNDKYFN